MNHAVTNADIERGRTTMTWALTIWFAAAFFAGLRGWVNQPGQPPLVLLGFFVVPIVALIAAYVESPTFRAFANQISLTVLVGAHVWRFVGVFFLTGALSGALAKGFGYPAGIGDIVAALWALLLIPMLRKGTASPHHVLAWNVFGLLDLLAAISTGLLYSNSSLGVLVRGGVTTERMSTFPVSLIPTFFVPLFILVHLLIFKRLAHASDLGPHGQVAD
jgi:hypothetical protein